jgi:hypothetical protein
LLALIVVGWSVWSPSPALSPVERALVGKWGRAETDPRFSFATVAKGPMVNPWVIQEFADDRIYRQWIISGDDPSHRFLHVQGRWKVVRDAIRVEDEWPGLRRAIEDTGNRIATVTGLPLVSTTRVGAARNVPFRLVGPDDLVVTFRNQDPPEWRLRRVSFGARLNVALS